MRVVVIGAGVGGMAAALRLAKAGCEVTVIEQSERVGGKLNVWEPDVPAVGRFRFDTGPHVLTMPWAIRELFEDLGERMEDHLDLVRMDPICRYHLPNGAPFDAPADPVEAARRIAERFPGDEAGFRALLTYAKRVHDVTVEPFLRRDFGAAVRGIPTPKQWRQLWDFLGLKPWRTLHDLSERNLRHPELRQIFDLYAFYNGSSPYKASAIFAIIAWVQWGEGTYYLRGGLRTYAEALARVAEKFGVDIRLGMKARAIAVGRGEPFRVCGRPYRQEGERIFFPEDGSADAIVCNVDPMTVNLELLPVGYSEYGREHVEGAADLSTSAFVLLLGVEGTPERDFPHLSHFNSFLPRDARAEFATVFDRREPADDPVIGVTCQSVTESGCAPPGHTNLFVMTSPPALFPSRWDWTPETTRAYRDRVLALLETRGGMPGLRQRIVCEQVWTPRTFAERYGAFGGSLYGLASNGWRSAFLRPPNRAKRIDNLYFVGGGTHPGGGLPLVTLGGKIVADAVLRSQKNSPGPS